jgi:hypothetical protein
MKCPKCNGNLKVSDLDDYDFFCLSCDENFYLSDVKQ